MDKKIEDYLHLYLGCHGEAETLMANYEWGVKRVDSLTPAMLTGVHRKSNRFKPILRPLSDMSEEEKRGVNHKAYCLQEKLDKNICEEAADLTTYLLSKHFDLFGLIEAGLAIDKTTIK